tara:strand:+ start:241 stop:384 length:144 start_codon:yes stop_codon:yes gene_type:complete
MCEIFLPLFVTSVKSILKNLKNNKIQVKELEVINKVVRSGKKWGIYL